MEESVSKPVLLVSARDKAAAAYIITEILHNENEDVGNSQTKLNELECVWKIINKYYTADVEVHALLDQDTLGVQIADRVEAHLIYLTHEECSTESAVETMQHRAQPGRRAHVRLAVADVCSDPPALVAACSEARLELVALREPAPDADDRDESDERGISRVRAALHAHLWPGLEHQGRTDLCERDEEDASSSDESWSEWCSGPDAERPGSEAALRAALRSLPAAAAQARAAAPDAPREERLQRAEHLVAAFCHALGFPFD